MPDPITWYALGRDVLDNQTIIEEMQAEILAHNQDVSAHGQGSEAIYNHRISELLDHVSYSIYNAKINPASRVYQAIVGDGLSGDFSGLQEAIDWTNLYGGGRILIKKGTYIIPGDITLYSNIILEGEDMDLTILDFQTLEHHIIVTGTSGTHKRNIEINNLQIKDSGIYESGAINLIYCDDCEIKNCKITGTDYSDDPIARSIIGEHCKRLKIEGNQFLNNDRGIELDYCISTFIEFNYFNEIYDIVLDFNNSPNTIFRHNNLDTNGLVSSDSMMYMGSSCDNSVFDSNFFLNCRSDPFWTEVGSKVSFTNNVFTKTGAVDVALKLNDVDRCVISGNRIYGFDSSGIYLGANSDYCSITGNVVTNNGAYGVDITASTCNRNVVVGNVLFSNSSGTVHDLGTSSVVANNSG